MSEKIDLSVCLVRTPESDGIVDFLKSFYAAADPVSLEAVVIDPAADHITDTINDTFAETVIFETGRPEKLPQALNRALAMAQGRYILLADEALRIDRQHLMALLAYMDDHPENGIFSPALVDSAGNPLPAAWSYPGVSTLLYGRPFPAPTYSATSSTDRTSAHEVDWLGGHCLVIRRETLDETGGFDESYQHAYFDLDLCWRARRHGWHIMQLPFITMHLSRLSSYHYGNKTYPADLGRFIIKKMCRFRRQ